MHTVSKSSSWLRPINFVLCWVVTFFFEQNIIFWLTGARETVGLLFTQTANHRNYGRHTDKLDIVRPNFTMLLLNVAWANVFYTSSLHACWAETLWYLLYVTRFITCLVKLGVDVIRNEILIYGQDNDHVRTLLAEVPDMLVRSPTGLFGLRWKHFLFLTPKESGLTGSYVQDNHILVVHTASEMRISRRLMWMFWEMAVMYGTLICHVTWLVLVCMF